MQKPPIILQMHVRIMTSAVDWIHEREVYQRKQ